MTTTTILLMIALVIALIGCYIFSQMFFDIFEENQSLKRSNLSLRNELRNRIIKDKEE